jgi:hypothetical protein
MCQCFSMMHNFGRNAFEFAESETHRIEVRLPQVKESIDKQAAICALLVSQCIAFLDGIGAKDENPPLRVVRGQVFAFWFTLVGILKCSFVRCFLWCSCRDGGVLPGAEELSDAARETGTLSCPTTQSRNRGVAVRCCQGDGDIELSYDPTQEPRGWLAHAIYF